MQISSHDATRRHGSLAAEKLFESDCWTILLFSLFFETNFVCAWGVGWGIFATIAYESFQEILTEGKDQRG
jgi:hypothetical protein